ncbi:MAG: hypothetical protein HZR80_20210 [Candidatus Heimdallarchaeota archaeon]
MSFVIDNYQWFILVSISFSALILAIIGIILRRRKQPKFRVFHIRMDPVTKSTHPARTPDICSVDLITNIINMGDYRTATKIVFKIKFNCKCKDDKGKRIIAEDYTYFGPDFELGKEIELRTTVYPHKNAVDWKRAKAIIFAKYSKTSGREVKRRIGCKRFKR